MCCSGFVPRMVTLSSVRGASHGFIMLQIAVKDVGALMMINWPILHTRVKRSLSQQEVEGRRDGGDIRLWKVVLRDVEKASRDGFERPELGEPEAFEVDDDERLAYRPTSGDGGGWEDLGEEGFDVDEDGAPVLLGRYVSVEPLVAYRAEALDVYRTAELHATGSVVNSPPPHKGKIRKGERFHLVGLWGWRVCVSVRAACVWAIAGG